MLRSRFDVLFEASPIGTTLASLDGRIIAANAAAAELLGIARSDLIGMRSADLSHPLDLQPTHDLLSELVRGQRTEFRIEKRFLRADGGVVWAQLDARLLPEDDRHPRMILAHLQDVTARRRREKVLSDLAITDHLTGLLNRRGLMGALEAEVARWNRYHQGFAVLMLDINAFKPINDTYGHAAGDRLLVRLADVLRVRLREPDLIARLGGDEFVAILVGTDSAQALRIANEVCDWTIELPGHAVTVTVAPGVAVIEPHDTPVTLLERADAAMYQTKRTRDALPVVQQGG